MLRQALKVSLEEVHWIREDLSLVEGVEMKVMARIRYRQPLQKATLVLQADGLYVRFDQLQSAITSGQFVAWYQDKELLGSGVIA